jgi:hypothetical protein
MALVEDHDPIQTIPPDRADDPLDVGTAMVSVAP